MKRKLEILLYSYQHLFFGSGGLQEQVMHTKVTLEQEGHRVYFLDEWLKLGKPKLDICHQFSVHFTLTNTFSELKSLGYPIVLSSVYNEETTLIKYIMRSLSTIGIPILYYRNIRFFLRESNYLITLGETETKSLKNKYKPKSPIQEIPNGISSEIINFLGDKQKIANSLDHHSYIVCVGTICKIKNQLSLIKICKKLRIKLILIGPDSKIDSQYVELCKAHADNNTVFTGYLSNTSDTFLQIISNASVFALISHKEVLPISVFEALAVGTKVVCTRNSAVSDYFKNVDFIDYCDPQSERDISRAIKKQMSSSMIDNFSHGIREKFTWSKITKDIEEVYYKTLQL